MHDDTVPQKPVEVHVGQELSQDVSHEMSPEKQVASQLDACNRRSNWMGGMSSVNAVETERTIGSCIVLPRQICERSQRKQTALSLSGERV